MRLSFDTTQRALSGAPDNNATPAADVCGIKEYIDKSDAANAHLRAVMHDGAPIADGEAIVLDNVSGYIEVPNAWNQFRFYDFGFSINFSADQQPQPEESASVRFINSYENGSSSQTGGLTVSKTVSGSGASDTEDFTFTVTLNDASISGTYGDMTFENGIATFTLKADESKTAIGLPAGTGYTVSESDNSGYTVTVNNTDKLLRRELLLLKKPLLQHLTITNPVAAVVAAIPTLQGLLLKPKRP